MKGDAKEGLTSARLYSILLCSCHDHKTQEGVTMEKFDKTQHTCRR